MSTVFDEKGYWLFNAQAEINKTKLIYRGDEKNIKKLKLALPAELSSDIYPYIGKDYDHLIFFYDVSPEFLTLLESKCKEILVPSEVNISQTYSSKKISIFAVILSFILFLGVLAGGYLMYVKTEAKTKYTKPFKIKKENRIVETKNTGEFNVKKPEKKKIEEETSDVIFVDKLQEPDQKSRPFKTVFHRFNTLTVFFVDVGQGDAEIIITPEKKCLVIDTGKNSKDGKKIISILKDNNIKKISELILTHPHKDHIGGAKYILDNFTVEKVQESGKISTSRTYKRILQTIKKKNIGYNIPVPGEKISAGHAITLQVFSSGRDKSYSTNNSSIVFILQYKKVRLLFTGDAETEIEDMMIHSKFNLKADVIKVGHHGSRTSSSINFLKKVRPLYAIIEVGKNNRYNHPKREIIERYKQMGVKVLRTDEKGDIELKTDGHKIKIKSGIKLLSFVTDRTVFKLAA